MAKIAVIGAGVVGVTTAYALRKRGHEVVVLERHRYPAMEASYGNGGQLSACNTEVWNSWPTLAKGVSWLFKSDAPLSFSLAPSMRKYAWLARFCGHIPNYRTHTMAAARLALQAREELLSIVEATGIRFDLARKGILHVYRDPSTFERAVATNRILRDAGVERHPVTRAEMLDIEPAVQGDFHGGLYTPDDLSGDSRKFTRELQHYCETQGVTFVFNAPVVNVRRRSRGFEIRYGTGSGGADALAADAVVIAAGVGSPALGRLVGDAIPIYPVKGYSITISLSEASQDQAPQVSLLDDSAKVAASRLGDDRLRVAGTAEFRGENRDIRMARIEPLLRWSERLFPGLDTSQATPWAGLRPMTPSMTPRTGAGRLPGVFYNTGHGHLGWTLSAATAEIVAAQAEHYIAQERIP